MILGDILLRNAALSADQTAIVFEDRRLSWRALAARVFRLANALVALGMKRGERLAILSQNCPEYLEVYGAGELCGWTTVTVNYRLSSAEIGYILQDSKPRFLIYGPEYAAIAAELGLPSLAIGPAYEAALAAASGDTPQARALPDDLAYLIYTSGTTGRPKGVMLTQAGQLQVAQVMSAEHCTEPTDRYCIVMPLYHVGGKILWMAGAWRGCTAVLHRAWRPQAFADSVRAERVTGALLAPTMLKDFLDLADVDASSLRKVFYSAAPMPSALLARAIARFGPIFTQFYGMTETGGPATALHRHQHDGTHDKSAGQPSPLCDVRVARPDGSECADETPGEILVRSPMLMRGYWGKPEATQEALRDGWMHTGDIGTRDAQGFITIVDRLKDMIVSGGENIYSREVEDALLSHPDIAEAAVVGKPDERWGEAVMAFIVLRPGATLGESDVIEHARTLIAGYKRPRAVRFVESLPRLPNGKVQKEKLRAPLWEGRDRRV